MLLIWILFNNILGKLLLVHGLSKPLFQNYTNRGRCHSINKSGATGKRMTMIEKSL